MRAACNYTIYTRLTTTNKCLFFFWIEANIRLGAMHACVFVRGMMPDGLCFCVLGVYLYAPQTITRFFSAKNLAFLETIKDLSATQCIIDFFGRRIYFFLVLLSRLYYMYVWACVWGCG